MFEEREITSADYNVLWNRRMSSGVQKEKTAFNGEIMKILKNTYRWADDSERVRYITQEKREFNEKTKKTWNTETERKGSTGRDLPTAWRAVKVNAG